MPEKKENLQIKPQTSQSLGGDLNPGLPKE
jgi:hypothetical protein